MTDYVDLFKTAAESLGYYFFYGNEGYYNFEAQQIDLSDGSNVLMMSPTTERPIIEDGMWSRYSVSCVFLLGRKTEFETISSLSETEMQKYINRLKELRDLMDSFMLNNIGCATNLEAKSIEYNRELNTLSTNIDVVSCKITFEAW